MVVWRITGNEIGPDGNGAAHFATKREAEAWLREHRKSRGYREAGDGPDRIEVRDRAALARALDEAMGFGAS